MEEQMLHYDIVIVGGGPAGLAAAISAKRSGADSILVLERDKELGGILNQCIHNGFGLHTFNEELTGPEYANRFVRQLLDEKIEYRLNTMVMDISAPDAAGIDENETDEKNSDKKNSDKKNSGYIKEKIVTAMNASDAVFQIRAKAVILAMGCRERPRGALNIPGFRPAGIFSAGTAQRLVNIEGRMPGKNIVILGSGDIGLIMARRMTLEGASVKAVAEIMPYSGGLKRNIVQCLDDYGIPLLLGHTVVDIRGRKRVEGITLAKVDENRKPVPGTEKYYECDTLLLSCGLLPENELSKSAGVALNPVTNGPVVNESLETNIEGVYACGNVLHVHDLVDYVSQEAKAAGENAAEYVLHCGNENRSYDTEGQRFNDIPLNAVSGIRYTVPAVINPSRMSERQTVRFRVGEVYRNCFVSVYADGERIIHKKRPMMAPGEMEELILERKLLEEYAGCRELTFKVDKN